MSPPEVLSAERKKKRRELFTHLLTPHSVVPAVNKSPTVFIFIHTHDDPLRENRTSVNRLGLGLKKASKAAGGGLL